MGILKFNHLPFLLINLKPSVLTLLIPQQQRFKYLVKLILVAHLRVAQCLLIMVVLNLIRYLKYVN